IWCRRAWSPKGPAAPARQPEVGVCPAAGDRWAGRPRTGKPPSSRPTRDIPRLASLQLTYTTIAQRLPSLIKAEPFGVDFADAIYSGLPRCVINRAVRLLGRLRCAIEGLLLRSWAIVTRRASLATFFL